MSRLPDEATLAAIRQACPGLGEIAPLAAGFDCLALAATGANGRRLVFKVPTGPDAGLRLRREVAVLRVLAPRVRLCVPRPVLHDRGVPFSAHEIIPGAPLLAAEYDRLDETAREHLAADLAGFAAEIHAVPLDLMRAAGAGAPPPWLPVEAIRRSGLPRLPSSLRPQAIAALRAFEALPPDPFGLAFGQFDGHGWNMAFDHATGRLNGLFDFGDSGIGPVHQDFIPAAFVAPDLTERIMRRYGALTGRVPDPQRVKLLTGVHRLHELAASSGNADRRPDLVRSVAVWAGWWRP